jgi:hypothetical protein
LAFFKFLCNLCVCSEIYPSVSCCSSNVFHPAVLLMYFISVAVILLASLALSLIFVTI